MHLVSGKVKLSERIKQMIIKLTCVDLEKPYDIHINSDNILYFYESNLKYYNKQPCTFIRFQNERSIYVKESVDEIYTMIRKGKKNG